jgi:hypothetical protein
MLTINVSLPVTLGQLVYHHTHPDRPGTIIGVVFRPSEAVLIRWRDGTSSVESLADLMKPSQVAA